MPYPTKYTRQYGFQAYQDANPNRPLPGDKVDFDYNAVQTSIGEIVEFLKLHARSDGLLKSGVVSMDSLGSEVLSAIALGDANALASAVAFTPAGGLSSTNVQAALEELDTEKLASTSYTAADVLAKLLTVDGAGSGLDADLLDGQSSAAFQPVDSDLTSIAALTTTTYGRSLLTQADATAARSTLGVVIGTNVQAYDAELAAIAGLTSAADRLPYFTGSGAAALATFTSAGRALIDDADAAAQRVTLGIRDVLSAARTYYVRTDGSDSNTGLVDSAGGAFLTIAKAISTVQALDRATYDVTIQVRSGTWTVPVAVSGWGPGSGTVTITGDTTTPSNVTMSVTGAAFTFSGGKTSLSGFKVVASTFGIYALGYAEVNITGAMEYGACTLAHMRLETYASVNASAGANYTISGGAGRHWDLASAHASLFCRGLTITITGTPAFTTFCRVLFFGNATVDGHTFSGSATGQRYSGAYNSVIYVAGGGATYLPGNSAGGVSDGGIYV